MKIYLYLVDKIITFSLPNEISGSFSFDENPDEVFKLINIEAKNGNWVIYSTEDNLVITGNSIVEEAIMQVNTFYVIRRMEKDYLIFVTDKFENSFESYTFNENIDLLIGNNNSCNIIYDCNYIGNSLIGIKYLNNKMVLSKNDGTIYINNVAFNGQNCYLKNGDQLNLYGLRIILLNGLLLINNPNNKVLIDYNKTNLINYSLWPGEELKDYEIKDLDLYDKNSYFTKSPRLRRVKETKIIDLSPPPKQENEKDPPILLTIGPMLTMGLTSLIMILNTLNKIYVNETTLEKSWSSLLTSGAMLVSMILWPTLLKIYNKKVKKEKKKEIIDKYSKYLKEKEQVLINEVKLQKEILIENLITVEECLSIIKTGTINFWDKRIDQSDFLVVRIGRGDALLDVKINYPKEGFTIDEDILKRQADEMVEKYKYIKDVPIEYSLYTNKITAIMGNEIKKNYFLHNIILQLITFYSYEDLKLVIFTNEKNKDKLDYIKYLNHNFSNDRNFRYFSSTIENNKHLADFLNIEVGNRLQSIEAEKSILYKPYYLIIIDDYDRVKRFNFIKTLTELDINLGFSIIILEQRLNKLPSKCNNFISLGENSSGLLKNSYEKQEQITFYDEINYTINMMNVAKKLSNIPIEFEEGNKQLPEAITFLEMEKVGKVEQLNVLNRWNTNDSTSSLRAEVGVDEDGNYMYLDLHEKYHGPHGLIAGMTGSGKSEFIITYILSMAINYSPDDVAFILIDYKGGGLAFAFENKATNILLPHLAGTITNLDKAEMDRTLVSIDSEIKRRQEVFNHARDELGESTIDIYKYQRFYKEGRLSEPIPHLFIICDEFAELKSQQPEFMDNLISVARIGRSLGVHLVLATQKPSGVVNDQIWSNTKFRVCLKVQDASDSKEMLKRPDAASLKQTGRFYLQVGYDEYFALGQSAWCGAKYYPSDKIIKQTDKSINFIDDTGHFIKSIQAGTNMKIEAQGEQLAAIMNIIIDISKQTNKKAKRLWLDNIEPIILINNLIKKYSLVTKPFDIKAIIGEYDAPEKQEQGILKLSFLEDGNTVIYGNDSAEREMLLNSIIFSTCISHKTEELNIYLIDYGSEALRSFINFPQVGGMVFMNEDEKLKNLFKLLIEEIKIRKKMLIPYGGSYQTYNEQNGNKLPLILFIINNYEGLLEIYNDIYEDIISISRDCQRYGIIIILTCNTPSTLGRRISQNFDNKYALHLTDNSDYFSAFNIKCKIIPRDIFGRGVAYNDGIHEFQTASIVNEGQSLNEYLQKVSKVLKENNNSVAPPIPALPERITLEMIEKEIKDLSHIPIGISKDNLNIINYDFTFYKATTISSNKITNLVSFIDSLIEIFNKLLGLNIILIDTESLLPLLKIKPKNYFNDNFDDKITNLLEAFKKSSKNTGHFLCIFYGLSKLKLKLNNIKLLDELFEEIKKSENINAIFCDTARNLKSLDLESWYSKIKNNTDGIWVGSGFSDQQIFRINKLTKDMNLNYSNDFGYYLNESNAELIKLLEFNILTKESDEKNEK